MITQQEFIDLIVPRYESKTQAFEAIGNALSISPSAVKKMANGTTELTYDRLSHLVGHYKILPEELFTPRKSLINASYVSLDAQDPSNYIRYINGLLAALTAAAADPTSKIMFAADEIPIFHFMRSKRLTYFKLFCYGYSMHKYDCTFEDLEKVFDGLGLEAIFEQIVTQYDTMDSTEIWDDYILEPLCDQIYFMHGVDAFREPTTVNELIVELRNLIKDVAKLCDAGKKTAGGKFEFVRRASRISPGYMLTETAGGMHLNIKLASINSLSVSNPQIISEMYKNFQSAMDMSIPFGVGVKREQKIYFKNLLMRTTELDAKLKAGSP